MLDWCSVGSHELKTGLSVIKWQKKKKRVGGRQREEEKGKGWEGKEGKRSPEFGLILGN